MSFNRRAVISTVLFATVVAMTASLILFLGSTAQAAGRRSEAVAAKASRAKVPAPLAELIASDAWIGADFGWSVSVSGSTAVVGAPYTNPAGGTYTGGIGAAYIFSDTGGKWTQKAELTPPAADAQPTGDFGWSVSISGKTVAVGAPGEGNGAAYVFTRSNGAWVQQGATLLAADGGCCDKFGWSVVTSGTTVVVGADKAYTGADEDVRTGAAFVFAYGGSNWERDASADRLRWRPRRHVRLVAGVVRLDFGGERRDPHGATGAIYVFTGSATWSQQAELVGQQTTVGDYFGDKIAISGTHIVAGGPGYNTEQGAAWVFSGAGANWNQVAMLTASDGQQNACFGWAVGLSGTTVLVGAEQTASDSGAAYEFTGNGSRWTQRHELVAHDGGSTPEFGYSASLSGKTAIISADGSDSGTGSAYIYRL
jgi:hypothetical protein